MDLEKKRRQFHQGNFRYAPCLVSVNLKIVARAYTGLKEWKRKGETERDRERKKREKSFTSIEKKKEGKMIVRKVSKTVVKKRFLL